MLDIALAVPQDVTAVANAVLLTTVHGHANPTFPLTVNRYDVQAPIVRPDALQVYSVPLPATETTAGGVNMAGSDAVAFTMTGETMSTTVRSVMFSLPVFITRIWYCITSPTPGVPPLRIFTTDMPASHPGGGGGGGGGHGGIAQGNAGGGGMTTGGISRSVHTLLVNILVVVHALAAVTYATSVTVVGTATTPTVPVTTNTQESPGIMLNPPVLHTYLFPTPGTGVIAGAGNPGGWDVVAPTTKEETVSTTVRSVTTTAPTFVTLITYPIACPCPRA
jgi:hypothetical protein